jgi:GH25 family lysozyme M1 (1,4-beta-N-acetylmuramidase)
VPGIDVAGFQHPYGAAIGWPKVSRAGYKFAAVKGTEGDYYVSPWAATDMAQAKAAGLDVTAYHFAIPNASTGTHQAQYAVEYSGYATGGQMLPLMLDIEYDPYTASDHTNMCYGLSARQMTAWIAAFVSETRSLTGQHPIIYTTANWWDTCTGGSTAFGADPMWVAAYGFASPPMPAGWPAWTFWQYTSGGTVPGVNTPGGTDLSSFSPRVVGLINPGGQASRPLAKVSLKVGSLGALAGEALTYSAAGLPPGLRVSAGGVISGTVASTGHGVLPRTYRATLSARNAAGARSTVAFGWRVSPSCSRYLAKGACPAA